MQTQSSITGQKINKHLIFEVTTSAFEDNSTTSLLRGDYLATTEIPASEWIDFVSVNTGYYVVMRKQTLGDWTSAIIKTCVETKVFEQYERVVLFHLRHSNCRCSNITELMTGDRLFYIEEHLNERLPNPRRKEKALRKGLACNKQAVYIGCVPFQK